MLRAGDGEISLVEAVKALRSDEDFAELLGFDGATKVNNSTKDRLSYALSEMDADGDKTISWDEFRSSILGLRNEAEPVLLIEDDELGGELDEDIGEAHVDQLLPSVIGDAILATYRRLDGLERSKADEEYCKTLESDIGRSNTKTDSVEKKLLEKLQIEKKSTNESLEKTHASINGLHEANGNTLLRVDEMKKMQQELSDALAKMDNDALSAVRDYLAPTLEKVKDTAASLEKFSFTTEFKLTELHEKKESKKRVEKKAEIEVVDLKAEQKDLEATTSLVNVINQTLAEALKRLARAEDQIKPLKKATASLNTAVRDLRRHANPMAPKVKEEPTMEELHSQRTTRDSRDSRDSHPQRSPRSLDPMPDRPKSPSFPPFPRSPRPRSPVHDNLMLHNMRMSWSRDGRRRDGSPDHSRRRVGFENDVPFVEDDPPRRVIPRRVKAPLGDVRRPESPWVDMAEKKRDERLARDYPRSRTPSAPAGNTGGL